MRDPTQIQKIQSRLREHLLWRRRWLSEEEREAAGKKVWQCLRASGLFSASSRLGLYWSHRGEVSTEILSKNWLDMGKELFFPRLEGRNLTWARGDQDWETGPFGILQPKSQAPSVEVNCLEALIIPGVVFDQGGARVGWGKGLYDRVLTGYGGVKVGLAYDFQVVPFVPLAPWDEKIDFLLTPSHLHSCR